VKVTASAAATVANLGPGYDVLGLCLDGPRDVVAAEATDDGLVTLVAVTGDGGKLPRQANRNCASVAARALLDAYGPPGLGVRLWLHKGLPLGSGLGSSAASAVAAVMATRALACPDLPRLAALDACREGERLATGTPHPDNVAPSLLGGIVACVPRAGEAIEVVRLPLAAGLVMAAVKPDVTVRTADARAALPALVPLADAVANVANVAGLVAALASGDLPLLGRCLADRLATPYRRKLIPGFDAAMAAATEAGALGGGISGSGPTCFALAASREGAEAAAAAMVAAFGAMGLGAISVVSAVDPGGARIDG
jgi:homoserine kinase